MLKKAIYVLSTVAFISTPVAASAQFGGLKKLLPGTKGTASSVNVDTFLVQTTESTKYVMASAILLNEAASEQPDLRAKKAEIEAIQRSQDVKELEQFKDQFRASAKAMSAKGDYVEVLQANFDKMDAEQKEIVASAAFNFALGMLMNAQLAGDLPEALSSIKSDPTQLLQAGRVKLAGELIKMQAEGMGTFIGKMPKVLSIGKVQQPTDAKATKPKPITF